jgi:hypothetical protein
VKAVLPVEVDEIVSRRVDHLAKPSRLFLEVFDRAALVKRVGRYSDDVICKRVGLVGQKRPILANDIDLNPSRQQAIR